MCFGGDKTSTSTSSSTMTPPQWLSNAANENLDFAKGLQSNGFTPYTGQQVANFAPQQSASFNFGDQITGGVSPYVGETGQLVDNYANAGPQSVSADTIASKMTPYMNQYVQQSLTPQLQAQDVQFANQNKAVDAAATGAGAFGDTGWGQLRGTTTQAQDAARSGLVANAYNTAFNTAIGAGAQDVANKLNADTTNANLAETALGRQLTGANTLYQMGTGADQLQNTLGGQQTAQSQAGLNADYNQWLMGQQYPFQTTQLMDQAIAAGRAGAPITTSGTNTQSTPDNSGFGILGSIAGSALRFVAEGGPVEDGQYAVVGERGPEVIKMDGKGVVIPNEVLQAASMLRDARIANGQAPSNAEALHSALQKPVRFMADGGFLDGLFDFSPSFMSGASSLATGNAGDWVNPDGPNATWQNPDNTIIPFGNTAGASGLSPTQALGDTMRDSKTWAGLSNGMKAAPPPKLINPNAGAATAPMAPVSLPGGGTSLMPVGRAPAQPQYQFGIAA